MISDASTPYIYEVSGEMLIANAGPGKYLETLYWIRNWVNDPVEHKSWDRKRYFSQWINQNSSKAEVEKWTRIMIAQLEISSNEFEELLEKVLKLRHDSEIREWNKISRKRLFLPDGVKEKVRRRLMPDTLPPTTSAELKQLKQEEILFEVAEVHNALKVIYS
jgi:hypothetical protein